MIIKPGVVQYKQCCVYVQKIRGQVYLDNAVCSNSCRSVLILCEQKLRGNYEHKN